MTHIFCENTNTRKWYIHRSKYMELSILLLNDSVWNNFLIRGLISYSFFFKTIVMYSCTIIPLFKKKSWCRKIDWIIPNISWWFSSRGKSFATENTKPLFFVKFFAIYLWLLLYIILCHTDIWLLHPLLVTINLPC